MNSMMRQVLLIAVLLAMPVGSYFLVFKPQNIEIDKAKKEIEHKEAMLAKLREATSQAENLSKANDEVRKSIDSIRSRLPSTKEMDNVLRQVSGLAGKNGLKVPVFKKMEMNHPAGLAMEQPIDLELVGDFDGLYEFLLELEQLPRITRITDLAIDRSTKTDGEMKAKLTLSIYYEGDSGALTP
jgi:type IV pilus assembly protein PilO